ncbi:sulfur carrier protein ThiS [Knoellia subterranea KCTC 19937]|uniref:Sulfur carrier protein ThiS n=1 Tax=Knoellia subterranea KCTC 19937 TaxID=1385521 RepID=A0A0A0JGQ7_9MICO|nr:sulfur carrier protein ThiS [Knoellia subterranea KCTC 19937]
MTLRYWAGARDAAGVSEETFDAGPSVGDILDAAVGAHPALRPVVAVCSVLVDGRAVGRDVVVGDDQVVELLPPFAGG